MNSLFLEELAALNALGALDGEDLQEFRRLSSNVSAEEQKEIADYDKVASLLSQTVAGTQVPPLSVKEKLVTRIHEANVV